MLQVQSGIFVCSSSSTTNAVQVDRKSAVNLGAVLSQISTGGELTRLLYLISLVCTSKHSVMEEFLGDTTKLQLVCTITEATEAEATCNCNK